MRCVVLRRLRYMRNTITAARSIGMITPTAIPVVAPVDNPVELDRPEAGIAEVDSALVVIVSVCPSVLVI